MNRNAVYIQFKANTDFTGQYDIEGFIKKVLDSVEQEKPVNIILVGEPVGDKLEFWAEGDCRSSLRQSS